MGLLIMWAARGFPLSVRYIEAWNQRPIEPIINLPNGPTKFRSTSVKRYYRDEVPKAPIPEEVTKGGDCTLMGVVLLDQDEWLSELIAPLGKSLQPIISEWARTESWIYAAAASGAIWFPMSGMRGF
jgi:hypothetical protein